MTHATPKFFLIGACAFVLVANTGCSPTVHQRGNMLQDYQITEIKPNESTRADVIRSLGSPTSKSTFDDGVWYYIGQETQKRGILDPEVIEERIVLVAFNEEGFVEEIKDIDRERMDIPYVRDKTPTHGNETTIVQQFLGNLGRFNPQQNQSATQTAGGRR